MKVTVGKLFSTSLVSSYSVVLKCTWWCAGLANPAPSTEHFYNMLIAISTPGRILLMLVRDAGLNLDFSGLRAELHLVQMK